MAVSPAAALASKSGGRRVSLTSVDYDVADVVGYWPIQWWLSLAPGGVAVRETSGLVGATVIVRWGVTAGAVGVVSEAGG